MGYEGLFSARAPVFDKEWMIMNKELEFNWEVEDGKSIYTNIFPHHFNFAKPMAFTTAKGT